MKNQDQIYALVDMNNCYVSCERAFDPQLNHVPVIVLSNNDGCVISRSEEAKQLGIKMAVPFYQIQSLVQQHKIQVRSSNYKLYNEISRRFHNILKSSVSPLNHEFYSIDEGFLNLSQFQQHDLSDFTQQIRQRIGQWLGIPVCIGIGRSKTEAKLANHLAKKNAYMAGVCNLAQMDLCSKEMLFQKIDVAEVWGVGRKNCKRLYALNIHSVFDLATADPAFIEKMFSVVMKRSVLELTGVSCLELEQITTAKKQIISSRSFGQRITDLDSLSEAMSHFLQIAVTGLRRQQSLCNGLIAFVQSGTFPGRTQYYQQSITINFATPTDSALQMNQVLMSRMSELFKSGIAFKKCGVILTGLENKATHIHDLWADHEQLEKFEKLQCVMDQVKQRYGQQGLAIGATQLPDRDWSMTQHHLSPDYFSLKGLPAIYH
ncbi:Y-family DNA polymerase [Acinetobacter chinensis]|jgi:DNA polymerase V|uniref:Y-family DNA polymerase n=1 Tax=Acinetobacter chinensis TaxID=2004650 RepID=UPI00293530E6|nr:DUF4113 domain-containing protein [Acinetobacter chinensis]WOE40476.1 DUF4113 domain-containing protein [Acinetobacter chinensis]